MTAFNSKSGGFQLTTVGRVQTPTLAIIVEREEKIRKFVSRDYWEVHGTFLAQAGEYPGRWFDENFSRKEGGRRDLKPERIWDKEQGRDPFANRCLGKPGIVTEESKPTTQLSPLLFDLTSLQREANGRFGYPAQTDARIAQALYERHKVLTYPRTDSRALPEDYIETVKKHAFNFSGHNCNSGPFATAGLSRQGWVRPNKRIFNNAKVSDHFAIIPTTLAPKNLMRTKENLRLRDPKRFCRYFIRRRNFS